MCMCDVCVHVCCVCACVCVCVWVWVLLGLIMPYTVGRNAFDITMKVTFTLPAKINTKCTSVGRQLRADQELHNNVIDVLQSMKVGWSRDSLSTGQAFTKALTSTPLVL